MSTPWSTVRRTIAQEMELWGGDTSTGTNSPGTFSSVDPSGSLYVVIDVTRPEPDDDWNGAYICINPGGSGNSGLATIWRRIADDAGFVSSTGVMTLTSPVPSAAYQATTMTYELYKMFRPEQWMLAANWALRRSFPNRHRSIPIEIPEDPETMFIDWGHLATTLTLVDPVAAPVPTSVTPPGSPYQGLIPAQGFNTGGTYTVCYTYHNSAGETKASPTATVVVGANQGIDFPAMTLPDGATGINYYCSAEAGGAQMYKWSIGTAVLGSSAPQGAVPGQVYQQTYQVPEVVFVAPPNLWGAKTPVVNTTSLDIVKLNGIKRRINPGQYPERYIDFSPDGWRPAGGTVAKLEIKPLPEYNLRLECIAPPLYINAETDTTDEPVELIVAGAMQYLWGLLAASGSAQNTQIWVAKEKEADTRFKSAKADYNLEQPRRTTRRPRIHVIRSF